VLTASIKQVRDTRVGDTITHEKKGAADPLPGFNPSVPVVFCGLFPVDSAEFEDLRDAIEKLALNDASFTYEMESSAALGFGFRCGFLGLLHLEVIRDRLEREWGIELITTAPSVVYRVHLRDGSEIELHNPADMPDPATVDRIEEPRIKATILVPDEFLGEVLKLCQDRRGIQLDLTYAGSRAMVVYDLPLNEVVFDFYDRLKSVTKGYASFDYQIDRLPRGQSGEDADPGERGTGGCALHDGAPRPGRGAGPRDVREAEGADPAAHVQDPDPGGHRRPGDRARDAGGAEEGRDREVLWRGRDAEEEAAGKAEGRARRRCASSGRWKSRRRRSSIVEDGWVGDMTSEL
jgi:hypothetical protein